MVAAFVLLGACSGPVPERQVRAIDPQYGVSASPRVVGQGRTVPRGGGVYKLGSPYKVAGRWYVPREEPGYDRTGLASWYGTDFHGRKTANGEVFDMNALTAAHPTLPLPSYAYVTNLENGRTLLVRINDRGPYAHDRILDLSRRSAQLLGTEAKGVAHVRVRYAGRAPLDGNEARELRHLAAQPWNDGGRDPAIAAPYAAPSRAAHAGWRPTSHHAGARDGAAPSQPLRDPGGRRFVQVGVFRDPANVARLRQELASLGAVLVVPVASAGTTAYRVRLGPFSEAEAHGVAQRVSALGSPAAQVVRD